MAETEPLQGEESRRLAAFRRAAAQVRDASIISQARTINIHARPGDPGYMDIYVELLDSEPFRSLALAVRLVYQQGEPAHFYSICNLLHLRTSGSLRESVARIRAEYAAALVETSGEVLTEEGDILRRFSATEVLETWLYGIAFHQNQELEHDVRLLESTGPLFAWSVQATALQLAGRVLDLDDIVAQLLGEPLLPRITAGGSNVAG